METPNIAAITDRSDEPILIYCLADLLEKRYRQCYGQHWLNRVLLITQPTFVTAADHDPRVARHGVRHESLELWLNDRGSSVEVWDFGPWRPAYNLTFFPTTYQPPREPLNRVETYRYLIQFAKTVKLLYRADVHEPSFLGAIERVFEERLG